MRFALPALAGLGLALLASGLPVLRQRGLTARVGPYLRGLSAEESSWTDERLPARLHGLVAIPTLTKLLPAPTEGLKRRLVAAGVEGSSESFRIEQALWGGAAVPLLVAIVAAVNGPPSASSLLLLAVAAVAGGTGGRSLVLEIQIKRRRERVGHELPIALDLLTLSVMAGEAIPAGLDRVGRLLQGDVGDEFRFAFGSMRTGGSLEDALDAFGQRVPHPGAGRLVDALCTAVERGTPVADALRAQADDLRESRRRHLLELGGRKEVLMLIPVVFLILPTLIAFALLPGVVSLDVLVP